VEYLKQSFPKCLPLSSFFVSAIAAILQKYDHDARLEWIRFDQDDYPLRSMQSTRRFRLV
jgi:hypothetical protein